MGGILKKVVITAALAVAIGALATLLLNTPAGVSGNANTSRDFLPAFGNSQTQTPTAATMLGSGGFVIRNGAGLTLNGTPYKFVGTNRYNLLTLGGFPYRGCGDWWTEADVTSWLAELKLTTDSNTVRLWAFPLFTADDTDFSRLDFVLNEADKHGIKVIPVLENQWADCTTGGYKLDTWYSSGYKAPYGSYSLAYHDPASPPSAPTDYVGKIVDRYKDDPRILMWQLINEAEIAISGGGCGSSAILHDFAADVSAYIKAIDANHLVSLGTIGSGQCGTANADYQSVHDIPTIDLCEYHDYGQADAPIPGDEWNGLQVRIDQCNALNKPMFIGESGIHACGDPDGPLCSHPFCNSPNVCYTKQERADFLEAKMDAFLNTKGGDGYLIWTYRDNYLMGQGDNDPTFRLTSTDPALGVVSGFGDADVDGTMNSADNCRNWYNPAQNLPVWPVPTGDSDCDGFPDSVAANGKTSEPNIGTDPAKHCAATGTPNDEAGPDAMPPDFNDDQLINGQDTGKFGGPFGSYNKPVSAGPFGPPGNELPGVRFDFTGNGLINGQDTGKYQAYFNKTCA